MDGDLNQEYITTHKGPSYCVSVGGLDEAQLTNSRTADQFTIQPVMAIREKVPQKSTTTTVTDSSSGNDNDPSQESTNQASLTIYKSHAGTWGTRVVLKCRKSRNQALLLIRLCTHETKYFDINKSRFEASSVKRPPLGEKIEN